MSSLAELTTLIKPPGGYSNSKIIIASLTIFMNAVLKS
jgi:hypothetical protein